MSGRDHFSDIKSDNVRIHDVETAVMTYDGPVTKYLRVENCTIKDTLFIEDCHELKRIVFLDCKIDKILIRNCPKLVGIKGINVAMNEIQVREGIQPEVNILAICKSLRTFELAFSAKGRPVTIDVLKKSLP